MKMFTAESLIKVRRRQPSGGPSVAKDGVLGDAPDSDSFGGLVDRDIARLAPDMADPRCAHTPDAAIERSAGDAPNDNVNDPDDLIGTEPVQCPFLLPPSAQSAPWWTALVLGRENDAVSPQDAVLALAHVAYRLGYARADTANPHHRKATVGQLHEAIEDAFGSAGWTAFTAGIQEPERSPADIPKRIPKFGSPSLSSSLPAASPESEPETLRKLPVAVARFWLKEPHVPAWRYSETADEQGLRERMEADGSWCG
jgi:hypothetical protein